MMNSYPERRAQASSPVLLVADWPEPIDVLAVQRFLDRDMRERRRGRRAVPMLQPGRKPDDIARAHVLDRPALTLNPAQPGRDDESLTKRMRVPVRTRARFKCHMAAAHTARG